MPRFTHPDTGQTVDVPAHRPRLAAYYRGEGYLEQATTAAVAAATDPGDMGDQSPDDGEQTPTGTTLNLSKEIV